MGVRIITDERGVKVWKDDKSQYPRYSISVSRKTDEGYENYYMEAKFKKDADVPNNGDEILIKDSFLSFNTAKDGKKYPYIMILDFEDMTDRPEIPDEIEEAVPFK